MAVFSFNEAIEIFLAKSVSTDNRVVTHVDGWG
jgi:hypothetical protein